MRTYERTHPWISFSLDTRTLTYRHWMMLGEIRSKCAHVSGTPLAPALQQELQTIYLAKGIHGTTSIEGNTLTLAQVQKRITKQLPLPASSAYLGQEIDNVLEACNLITRAVQQGEHLELTPNLIMTLNGIILKDLEVEEGVFPGEVRTTTVGVGNYSGPPPEDCPYLLEKLCEWLKMPWLADDLEAEAVLKALLGHLYIAWIHPFGDGNGRTARLIEFMILVQSGTVPVLAGNLLSDHFNKTRTKYYRELELTSKTREVNGFLYYALEGFVDGLREQVETIRQYQWGVIWRDFVHRQFDGPETPTISRRKHLVLDMPPTPLKRAELPLLSPRVAAAYAGKTERTIARDLNALVSKKLVVRIRGGYLPNHALLRAFIPVKARAED